MQCQTCGETIIHSKVSQSNAAKTMYCSRSCSAKMTNILYPKRGKEPQYRAVRDDTGAYLSCLRCMDSFGSPRYTIFCGEECRIEFWSEHAKLADKRSKSNNCLLCIKPIVHRATYCGSCWAVPGRTAKINSWLSGDWSGAQPRDEYLLSEIIRNYLMQEAKYSCTKCGFNTPHPDGSTVLQINHIDGHANNHNRDNLEVLCPNCHALTITHGGRNKGNGRPSRRIGRADNEIRTRVTRVEA